MKNILALTSALFASVALTAPALSSTGERVKITGEIIDTWCYISEVMGGEDAATGSAHHQCAVWCAAGGIPVGLLTEKGDVYMVLKLGDDDTSNANPRILEIQSDKITADGTVMERDGIKYLLIDSIVENAGLVNKTHEDYGVIPAFGVPEQ